jgi:putative glutamine amidotransferase
MTKSPIIVVSCRRVAGDIAVQGAQVSYLKALHDAGAQPILLPIGSNYETTKRVVEIADGVLFPGGEDISDEKGGSRWSGTTAQSNHVERDELELQLVAAARNAGKPMLGICRGVQMLNVAYGGRLIGDIRENDPSCLPHMGTRPSCSNAEEVRTCFGALHHSIRVDTTSWLYSIFSAHELEVNSFHHQAVDPDGLGAGLRPCAWAPDGTIEAIEGADMSHFVAGVQWHPEMLVHFGNYFWKTFFQRFVDVCRQPQV